MTVADTRRGYDWRFGRQALWWTLLLCLGVVFALQARGADGIGEQTVPVLHGPVTDLTGTLTPQQAAQLEGRLREFEILKGSQIAVLLVPTTQPETIEQYSIRVVDAWLLGRKGTDDGVLLLVAKDDRTVRIEVGRGLEGALPDVIANRIIDQVVVPRFRAGDFFGGLDEAVTRIIALVEGEPLPELEALEQSNTPAGKETLLLLLMLTFMVGGVLRSVLGSLGGAVLASGLAGLLAWMLTGMMAISIGAAVIAFLFTVLGGGGSGWTNARRGQGSWSAHHGNGWGGGFGGSTRGGWSGGGGSFGGGGATGRW
ncbi:TPM domain-containing protein [Steroidobacter denitrificans]|uniref:TPM domain-containing protein n=1 Tax=Steroidobacter denitrificans TaxID=465721 RepID=UPI0009F9A22C